MPTPRISVAAAAALLLAGCGSPPSDTGREAVRRDSAGVAIAETPGEIWSDAPRWTASTEPLVEIGAVEGSPEYLLTRIRGVEALKDGRIVVADGGSSTLRWYDESGRYLFERGGTGEGPGEFSLPGTLVRTANDLLVLTDLRLRRITEFSPSGELLRTVPVEGIVVPGPAHRFPDGSFVVGSTGFSSTQLTGEQQGLDRVIQPLLRIGDGLEGPDTIGMFPGPEMYFTERSFGSHPFARGFHYAVQGDLLFVATAEGFVVNAYSADGRLVRSIRAPEVDERLTPEMIDAYRRSALDAAAELDEAQAEATLDRLEDMFFPETRPAYARFVAGEDALWLEEHRTGQPDGENRWAVFGHDGEYRGVAVLPPNFRLHTVRGDRVLGVWTDDLGVEYARIHRLEAAGG